ncbi:TMEM175 family protein [Allobranchiibius sp. CTAmp26]|uniref:TMEM175 family protein n=1 Tax=Allobranchiibius sp. CTAmp26 TaxID=2815214 RepID=UPI001AA0FD20|nr:TMEM175 family protein [Allobranchiibius sp. CTAmp26]MBO1755720.1 DUF1211 domain-containing protein [Allobranchiibius sp. CTAmp26]
MDKTSLEAFSDGVIAVAITLLVIDLRVPEPARDVSLAHRLGEQWPSFAAYVVSFLTIGVIWVNHHATLRRLRAVDRSILFLNIALLMTIVLLPFTTALMARYLLVDSGRTLAAALYGGSLLLMSAVFLAMNWHLLQRRTHLLHAHITPAYRRHVLSRNLIGVAPYLLATAVAFVSPYLTLAISAAVAVYFVLPGTTPDMPGDA